MAYDEDMAARIRALVGTEPGLTEKRMFGGLAFLVGGNMAVATGDDEVMVRADAGVVDELVDSGDAEPVIMRGRTMRGWLCVPSRRLHSREQLARWVELGVAYARTLPAK